MKQKHDCKCVIRTRVESKDEERSGGVDERKDVRNIYHRSSVVGGCDGLESLLASCVPVIHITNYFLDLATLLNKRAT